jgi:exo-1,4-beta-D-glucosaminidase
MSDRYASQPGFPVAGRSAAGSAAAAVASDQSAVPGCRNAGDWYLYKGHISRTARVLALPILAMLVGAASAQAATASGGAPGIGQRLPLRDGWALRSSAAVNGNGAALSTVGFPTRGWTPTRVPATVVAARVAHGELPDPGYGMNLRNMPGTSDYAIGARFSHTDMSSTNPYRAAWWYRTEFDLAPTRERIWLHCDGINYRANIWLNGKQVAGDRDVAGAYRRYVFDVTGLVKPGQRNALAVEVYAPGKNDLAPTFIDWNPSAPDRNMGIWQDVYLTSSGPVTLEHPFVVSRVPSKAQARLTINAELKNNDDKPVVVVVSGAIGSVHLSETFKLAAHETRSISLTPEAHPELVIGSPRLWWPYQLGPQNLHDLVLTATVNGVLSDRSSTRFGIREVAMDLVDGKWARFRINGTPLLIRGGGYTSDILLRFSDGRDDQEMQLVKDLGLNTIRIEGKLADDHLFDVTDREGILVMPGWECCSAWEYWVDDQKKSGIAPWNEATRAVAAESLRSQLLRLRGRASVFTFLYGSDSHPPPDIEKIYLGIVKETRWPLPTQNQASERDPSTVTGSSGLKMTGPYDYVPPAYWYVDHQYGGAFGFNSETGPGASVPNVDSLVKFLPRDKLWPINEVWNYHMGGDHFANLEQPNQALDARYGKANGVEDYARKAQALQYDSQRAMFEAYRRNKGNGPGGTTGLIAWMLNGAWPSLLWHLWDYYLAAGGSYYGVKKANELVHIQYSYDDRSVVVVNDSPAAVGGLKARAEIYDLQSKQRFADERAEISAPVDKSVRVLGLPPMDKMGPVVFVRLTLRNQREQVLSQNFYWLSAKADVLDWAKTDWWGTPVITHGDLTALRTLPTVTPVVSASSEAQGTGAAADAKTRTIHVTLHNRGKAVAFLLRLRVLRGNGGDEVLPTSWSDNYVSLLPGEQRELTARVPSSALAGAPPVVVVSGWNIPETTIQAQRSNKNAAHTGRAERAG